MISDKFINPNSKTVINIQIVLLSCVILFFELTLIRWLPANIYSLAFFSNLVLMATFYGFGLGILSGKFNFSLLKFWPFYILILILVVVGLREFNILVPEKSIEWMWSSFKGDQLTQPAFHLSLEPTLIIIFFLVSFLFVPLGQFFSRLMIKIEALNFYHYDLLGSLIGIVFFTYLSFLETSPFVWFIIGLTLMLPVFLISLPKKSYFYLIPLLIVPILIKPIKTNEKWSHYYSIITDKIDSISDFKVYVNRFYHQEAVNFNKRKIWGYDLPYMFSKKDNVLIVGAGTGNDIANALLNGAQSVDAVEIDPAIRNLGYNHPLKPYQDNRVNSIIQDARTYLQTTEKKYDLIVFGTLDSHALMSNVSSVRLDNYVYTIESIQSAKKCLKSDGTLAMLYSIPTDWIFYRLRNMVTSVFTPDHVLCFFHKSNFLNFVVIANNTTQFDKKWDSYKVKKLDENILIPTDDWPFLYLKSQSIPDYLLTVIIFIILIGLIPVLLLLPKGKKKPHMNFLLLGTAFLLLETMTVTRMSLLFGSTWIVNSVVFFSIVFMILLANFFVNKIKDIRFHWVYSALIISLMLNFFIGPDKFLYSSFFNKALFSGTLAALPIFFAGIIFSYLFSLELDTQHAFGSNLLGTLLGGFIEYLGMIIGFKKLILVIMVIYLLSYLNTCSEKTKS
ncbi:MAG: spermidine synthase-like protein [uncultured bacterium]|nr:MAG: spermidine synthase-like protein [uncultured bacterium]